MQDAIGVFLVELGDERLLCGHPECGRMDWHCVLSTPVLMLIQIDLDCSRYLEHGEDEHFEIRYLLRNYFYLISDPKKKDFRCGADLLAQIVGLTE